jgi:hypothetical protein
VSRFWQDAASIFETATAVADASPSHIAILMDERNGLRIVDSAGWTLDALRREYQVQTAYSVQRTGGSVVVQADNGAESCTMKRNLSNSALTNLGGVIPHHLIRPALLA